MRGSYSIKDYKRIEAEFIAPRLFHRRGTLSVLGGWREATQVGFYGIGMDTSTDDRLNYKFRQPHGSATLEFWPTRRLLMLRGGLEVYRWTLLPGEGSVPSVDTVYTPATLPGLGTETTYVHSQGTVGLDWRTSQDYTRRGGFYGVTLHDYHDRDGEFGFQADEVRGHPALPILREAWVLSLHGVVQTAFNKDGQEIPFFMLPSVGGGSTLRGYSSWRFRDQNSLVVQAEWRIMVNRFIDTAVFYDAGKVTSRTSDLDFNGLKNDYGFGVRFHTARCDAIAHRGRQEPRRSVFHFRFGRELLRIDAMSIASLRSHTRPAGLAVCLVAALGIFASAGLDEGTPLLS